MHAQRRTVTAFLAGLACILGIAARCVGVAGSRWWRRTDSPTSTERSGSRIASCREHDPRLRREDGRRRRDCEHGGRLAAGRSRVRERQALRRRGVRCVSGDRDRRRRTGVVLQPDPHGVGLTPAPRARERGWQPRRLRPVRHGHGRGRGHALGHAARSMGQQPGYDRRRVHAGVFSKDGNTLYLASDATSEVIALDPRTGDVLWRMTVPGAHELAVTHDGKTAYVSCRTLGQGERDRSRDAVHSR